VGTYNVGTAVAMVTMKLEGNSSASRRRSHQTLAGTGFTNARRPRTVVRSGFDRIDSGDPRHAAESGQPGAAENVKNQSRPALLLNCVPHPATITCLTRPAAT
jgi:hypothetical protein